MKHACEALVIIAALGLIAVCLGDPDILDGWAKRANGCAAQTETDRT